MKMQLCNFSCRGTASLCFPRKNSKVKASMPTESNHRARRVNSVAPDCHRGAQGSQCRPTILCDSLRARRKVAADVSDEGGSREFEKLSWFRFASATAEAGEGDGGSTN